MSVRAATDASHPAAGPMMGFLIVALGGVVISNQLLPPSVRVQDIFLEVVRIHCSHRFTKGFVRIILMLILCPFLSSPANKRRCYICVVPLDRASAWARAILAVIEVERQLNMPLPFAANTSTGRGSFSES